MKHYTKPTINKISLDSLINLHMCSEHPGNGNHNGHGNDGNHNGHDNPNNPWNCQSNTFVNSPFKQSPFE
jgi:hypothetical protein